MALFTYFIMKYMDKKTQHKVVLVFNMAYLWYLHIQRLQNSGGQFVWDISKVMMPITFRLVSAAFCYRDSASDIKNPEKDLTRY
mmetsp:Transcript_36885/g.27278  ORF Transcript_36885/g.27278 Transcript_36885/m.27278 type:complete len:84 (-) Transcript_36885:998-1249(-)